jgi:hypothetical protein
VTVPDEAELDPPQPVVALAGVPVDLVGRHPPATEPLGDQLAERRPGGGLAGHPDGHALCLLSGVLTFLQHRSLEPADSLDRDTRGGGDLLRGFPRTDAGLDLLGAQRTLHFDLVLAETGEVAADRRTEPFVDRKREPCAPTGRGQYEVCSVLAYRDESELLHAGPFVVMLFLPPDP